MAELTVKEQIIHELDKLSEEQQREILNFVKQLRKPVPPAVTGRALLEQMQSFKFAEEDLREIERAIEEGCERVDWDEW